MALSSARKLHRRLFSAKPNFVNTKFDIQQEEIVEPKNDERNMEPSVRYTVCRDRPKESRKFTFPKTVESDETKMDAGFGTENEGNLKHMSGQIKEDGASTKSTSSSSTFAASTTYKNVVLPLKLSKLASPFPSPVKIMPSHTVSDQEKADQMYQERRMMQKAISSMTQKR